MWTLTILCVTPSLNETQRHHWSWLKRQNESLAWSLRSGLNKGPKIPSAIGKRRMVVERHGRRLLDQDNLAGGAKGLIDAIKAARLITDDKPDACELVFRQVVARGPIHPYTVISLEDVEAVA